LAGAIVVFIVVRMSGTRTVLLVVASLVVAAAALAARFGRHGLPRLHRMRRVVVGTMLVLTTLVVTAYFGGSTVGATWFGGGLIHGPRDRNEVAITFDDGPNVRTTPAVMRILDRAGVKGTFFLVGKALDAEPQIAHDLYEHGHLLGNHSYHHDEWRWLDPRYPELARTQDAFARQIGTCPVWFRPPHGQKTPMMARVVNEHHMEIALWDVSAADWATDDADEIARRVVDSAEPGSIIDLHDGLDGQPWVDRSVVVRALPKILDGLAAKGLRPVRLDELVGGRTYQPCEQS
jgi:peptidoglycan/xylan/chitin deacetylase (PgdA/CDA1 family)